MAGRWDQKKAGQGQQTDKDKEGEKDPNQEKKPEAEQNKAHSTVGNQALNAMINARAEGSAAAGDAAGSGRSVRVAKPHEKEGQDYGGTDDVVDDVPITLEDLAQSWNPGIRKSDDRVRFVEPMPDDDLPPEDEAWLAELAGIPMDDDMEVTLEHFLQPSVSVVATSLRGWCRGAARFSGPTPGERVLAAALLQPPSVLQSSDARVLLGRTALANLALQLVVHAPALAADPDTNDVLVVWMCLELEGRIHRVDNVLFGLEGLTAKLPRARDLWVERHGESEAVEVEPAAGADHAVAALRGALAALCRWEDLEGSVPQLGPVAPADREDDDPLGLDAILVENTGGPPDPLGGVYLVAVQNAERLAAAASVTRLRWVATAFLVEEVAGELGTTLATSLIGLAEEVDARVDQALQLLLEVARASQKRSVAPKGVRNGLAKVARQLDILRAEVLDGFAVALCGLLEGEPVLPPATEPTGDVLDAALDARDPQEALEVFVDAPPIAQVLGARAVLAAMGGRDPGEVAELAGVALGKALRERDDRWVVPASLVRAHALLAAGDSASVLTMADGLRAHGAARNDGLLIAEAGFLAMEAYLQLDDAEAAASARLECGRACARLGARSALSLLARWTPPIDDDVDYAPFFDYPMTVDDAEEVPPASQEIGADGLDDDAE